MKMGAAVSANIPHSRSSFLLNFKNTTIARPNEWMQKRATCPFFVVFFSFAYRLPFSIHTPVVFFMCVNFWPGFFFFVYTLLGTGHKVIQQNTALGHKVTAAIEKLFAFVALFINSLHLILFALLQIKRATVVSADEHQFCTFCF